MADVGRHIVSVCDQSDLDRNSIRISSATPDESSMVRHVTKTT